MTFFAISFFCRHLRQNSAIELNLYAINQEISPFQRTVGGAGVSGDRNRVASFTFHKATHPSLALASRFAPSVGSPRFARKIKRGWVSPNVHAPSHFGNLPPQLIILRDKIHNPPHSSRMRGMKELFRVYRLITGKTPLAGQSLPRAIL